VENGNLTRSFDRDNFVQFLRHGV